jgi:hypothetical protein
MDQPRANLREPERGMECAGVRIWWIDVDLTNDLIVTGARCLAEQPKIQIFGNAAPSRLGR